MKKKTIILGLIAITLLSLISPISAFAREFTIFVDGQKADVYTDGKYVDSDNELFLSIRPLCEIINLYVDWDNDTQSITMTKNNNKLIMQVNNPTAVFNGVSINMDKPASIVDSRTLIPVNFVVSLFGYSSTYDAKNDILSIVTNGNEPPEIQTTPYVINNVSLSDLCGNKLTSIPSQGKFMINLDTVINTATDETGYIIIGKYDKNDCLVDYDFFSTAFNFKPIMSFSISIDQAEGTEKIKLFMWNNIQSMMPISNSVVIE